jgi:signal transduction histidine kinase
MYLGKYLIFVHAFLVLIFCQINAETFTIINSIQKNGAEVPKEMWTDFTASTNDSITFYFTLEGDKSTGDNIEYKVFLTGSNSVPALIAYKKNSYTLKNLNQGDYIFKVQGFVKNIETAPAVIRFSVKNSVPLKQVNNDKTDSGGLLNVNTIVMVLLSIIIAGLIITLFLLKNKINSSKFKNSKEYSSINNNKGRSFRTEPADKLIKTNQEQTTETEEEFFDYQYAYNNLRKEYERLKDENSFLRNQIDELNSNVKDLENANIQLSKQKERLLDSKRQLEELQAQKEELFTIALHDIKNPASAIKGFVELLEDYDLNANDQQEIMQSLMDTSSKIIELAQQMSVAIARQAPEPAISPEKASIKVITDSVCKRNIAYAKKKGINLINNTSPNTPETGAARRARHSCGAAESLSYPLCDADRGASWPSSQ